MSDTPRTDTEMSKTSINWGVDYVHVSFAQQLERELAAAITRDHEAIAVDRVVERALGRIEALESAAQAIEADDSQRFGWTADHKAIAVWLRVRAIEAPRGLACTIDRESRIAELERELAEENLQHDASMRMANMVADDHAAAAGALERDVVRLDLMWKERDEALARIARALGISYPVEFTEAWVIKALTAVRSRIE